MHVTLLESTIEIDETVIAEPSRRIREQVREYEAGERSEFDLSVEVPDGLTGDVMSAMAAIPYGETRAYGAIAADLDTAPVAVGQACGRNPVPLIVPCHRVVGKDGELRGYSAADGVTTKQRLLEFEAVQRGTTSVQTRLPTE